MVRLTPPIKRFLASISPFCCFLEEKRSCTLNHPRKKNRISVIQHFFSKMRTKQPDSCKIRKIRNKNKGVINQNYSLFWGKCRTQHNTRQDRCFHVRFLSRTVCPAHMLYIIEIKKQVFFPSPRRVPCRGEGVPSVSGIVHALAVGRDAVGHEQRRLSRRGRSLLDRKKEKRKKRRVTLY